MRIELNSGGLPTGVIISDFQSDFQTLVDRSRRMVSSFQTIKIFACNMNGGIGVLQDAVNQIDTRISADQTKAASVEKAKQKAEDFIGLAKSVDLSVSILVNKNKQEFYNINPWAKPPPPPKKDDRNFLQKGWDWACKKGEEFVEWGKETVSKAWDTAVAIYENHKDAIRVAVGGLVIATLAIATVCTGGATSVFFAPMAMSMICGAAGATVGAGMGAIEHRLAKGTWEGAGRAALSGAASGFMTGTITGAISGAAPGWLAGTSKGVTTLATGGINAGATAIASVADELIKDGSLKGDGGKILLSTAISFGFSARGAYKNYGNLDTLGFGHVFKKAVDIDAKNIQDDVIIAMKNNLIGGQNKTNVVLYGQQQLKNLRTFSNLMLDAFRGSIKDLVKDELWGSFKDEIKSKIPEVFNLIKELN